MESILALTLEGPIFVWWWSSWLQGLQRPLWTATQFPQMSSVVLSNRWGQFLPLSSTPNHHSPLLYLTSSTPPTPSHLFYPTRPSTHSSLPPLLPRTHPHEIKVPDWSWQTIQFSLLSEWKLFIFLALSVLYKRLILRFRNNFDSELSTKPHSPSLNLCVCVIYNEFSCLLFG